MWPIYFSSHSLLCLVTLGITGRKTPLACKAAVGSAGVSSLTGAELNDRPDPDIERERLPGGLNYV